MCALYETALQRGYNIMHPNCKHEFIPFFEEFESPEELKKTIEESNRFEDYDKNDELFRKYNQDQAFLRQLINEKREFDEAKELYGDQMPYKTLSGFRRSRREYNEARKKNDGGEKNLPFHAVRERKNDNNQYNRWKEVLGEENMPKTLAEFQELKHNKNVEIEKLHAFKDYRKDNPTKTTTREEFEKIYQIQRVASNGVVNVPPEEVNVESLLFDDEHINKERKHLIKKEEAISFIESAQVSITVWNGRFERYYSTKGVAYVDKEKMCIRTAYKPNEFTGSTNDIMEVIKKWI